MATEQLTPSQFKAEIQVKPSDFSYVKGEWITCGTDLLAQLVSATQIEATADVNAKSLTSKQVAVFFGISKPEKSFGWEHADLCISAEMGTERTVKSINAEYLKMVPGSLAYFILPFQLFSGIEKVIRLTLFDNTTTLKGGLFFHGAIIKEPIGA